jgi:hypothetical protein
MAHLLYPANASLFFHNELASVLEHADGYVRIDWNPVPSSSLTLRTVYCACCAPRALPKFCLTTS